MTDMRVFIAGAGGTLGLPLVRRLAAAGHTVTGLTRSAAKRELLEAAGARPVIADALEWEAVREAVGQAAPTHVVNLLTALPPAVLRPRDLAPTNRLRTRGAAILLEAAIEAGASRLVAESFLGVFGRPEPTRPLTEEDPLGPVPAGDPNRETVMALRSLEETHAKARHAGQITTVVLRYGFFYGPGVPSTEAMLEQLRVRKLFLPKSTGGVASWIHIDDAVSATVAALEHPRTGFVYHVADDDPVGLDIALGRAATVLALPPPRTLPAWLLRLLAPTAASLASARLPLDNRRAKADLNWKPWYPNVTRGFAALARETRQAA